jgi:glycosyltransferase involved in cell wall biosynthesis
MKFGIDASCWTNLRGYGRYTRELLRAVVAYDHHNHYRFFLTTATAKEAIDLPSGPRCETVVVETSDAPTRAASAEGRRSLRDLWAMTRAVDKYGNDLDLFFFPSVYTYFPVRSRAKIVVTIHDTIAERFPQLVFPTWRSRLFWNLKVRGAIWQSDLIATVSQSAKRDIVEEFRLPAPRVRVIPNAVDEAFRRINDESLVRLRLLQYGIDPTSRIILYVGGISPHKNLEVLVDAYAALRQSSTAQDTQLVLVGDFQHDVFYSSYSTLKLRIDRLGLGDHVAFTGFVADDDLPHFYNAALVVVLPSVAEGFGLPALEAMACGTPVVASEAGSLPEVVGDGGLFFDPRSPEALCICLRNALENPQLCAQLSCQALLRATEFSWKRSAEVALATFEELVGTGRQIQLPT